jgi:hypothetical protein
MTLKPWLIAALAVSLLALGAAIGKWYVPSLNPDLHIEFNENSCAISCPVQSAYPSLQGSVSCTVGSAPLCQCTDGHEPMARCVPVN